MTGHFMGTEKDEGNDKCEAQRPARSERMRVSTHPRPHCRTDTPTGLHRPGRGRRGLEAQRLRGTG